MKRILIALVALGITATSNAQLWDGSPLPPTTFAGLSSVDAYFADGGALSEFDNDIGLELSLQEGGTKPAGINGANGWVDASTFATTLEVGDSLIVTYLGKTAGWNNDFGMTVGGMNAYEIGGGDAHTLWASIVNGTPAVGDQYTFGVDESTIIDFWLNSGGNPPPSLGGTYSVFFPTTSDPSNTGLPDFDYSALGKIFNVHDSFADKDRSILVIAIEDWRDFDRDFTDMFFAIEIYDRDGTPQFPVPEPSTYGLIGAMMLLGLVAVRRARRS